MLNLFGHMFTHRFGIIYFTGGQEKLQKSGGPRATELLICT